jgi:hypothetical protein
VVRGSASWKITCSHSASSLNRAAQKNLALLQSLQATPQSLREAAIKEATALLRTGKVKGLDYAPTQNGFVFSTTEIHPAIDRDQRLERASTANSSEIPARQIQTEAA